MFSIYTTKIPAGWRYDTNLLQWIRTTERWVAYRICDSEIIIADPEEMGRVSHWEPNLPRGVGTKERTITRITGEGNRSRTQREEWTLVTISGWIHQMKISAPRKHTVPIYIKLRDYTQGRKRTLPDFRGFVKDKEHDINEHRKWNKTNVRQLASQGVKENIHTSQEIEILLDPNISWQKAIYNNLTITIQEG